MSQGDEALYAQLSGTSNVTNLVGTRIYPVERPQGDALPAITYQQVSGPRVQLLNANSGAAYPLFQVNCYGEFYPDAKALGKVVRIALHQATGTIGGETVHSMLVRDSRDNYDPPVSAGESGIFWESFDVRIWHAEDTS